MSLQYTRRTAIAYRGRGDKRGRAKPLHAQVTFMALHLLHRLGGVIEVRIPGTPKGTLSGCFDNYVDLVDAVGPWNGLASIYVTINELVLAVLTRAWNRLREFAPVTTNREDVRRRLWFALDVDAVRPRGIPSTDAEMALALARRDEVIAYLCTEGLFPVPLRTLSGNAGWALWPVDLPNSNEITALYRAALTVLDQRFSDQDAKVDPAVAEPAQLMKLPGTLSVTGDEIPGRPYRLVGLQPPIPLHLLENPELVAIEHLRWLASQGAPSKRTYSFPAAGTVNLVDLFKAKGLYLRELPHD